MQRSPDRRHFQITVSKFGFLHWYSFEVLPRLFRFKGCHINHEAILHVTLEQQLIGLVNLVDGDGFLRYSVSPRPTVSPFLDRDGQRRDFSSYPASQWHSYLHCLIQNRKCRSFRQFFLCEPILESLRLLFALASAELPEQRFSGIFQRSQAAVHFQKCYSCLPQTVPRIQSAPCFLPRISGFQFAG